MELDNLLWEYGHLMHELQTCNDYFTKRKIEARMNEINDLLGVPEIKSGNIKDLVNETKRSN